MLDSAEKKGSCFSDPMIKPEGLSTLDSRGRPRSLTVLNKIGAALISGKVIPTRVCSILAKVVTR
jgi:hypothetical protein